MPVYKYSAVNMNGTKTSGRIDAASEAQLGGILNREGLFLTSASLVEQRMSAPKLKLQEVADFCRQLAAMLASGITLIRAMMIIEQRDTKPHIRKIYQTVIAELQRGSTLSEALTKQGKAFPELLINMMRAGESSGRMDITAQKMADTFDKQHRLNQKLKSATVYPIILVIMIIGVILIIFTFVLPSFFSMFESMDELPMVTRVVIGISAFLTNYFWLLGIVVAAVAAALWYTFRQPVPKRHLDRLKLKLPKIGILLSTIYTGRFARTLSSLYVSGIPMIQALTISRNTIGNKYIEWQFDGVIDALGNGRTLSQSLSGVDGFETKLNSTILIGEESGRLEQMLESTADQYDYDSEMATTRLITMLEPLLICVMAGVVAFVMISVMLPIYQLYQNIGAGA
ncbi:MAG: type II secretion system F family protein [Clostridiales Family XIII bacterium]|jgi:type IV pilus assembly protein PilC|nr:type II secretion system F family protein [Clostridiales Family XIII bacterium]